jgi:hypothetical protein
MESSLLPILLIVGFLVTLIAVLIFKSKGASGPIGQLGLRGNIGPTGAQGPTLNIPGVTGPIGPQGIRGSVGPSGPIGLRGPAVYLNDLNVTMTAPGTAPSGAFTALGPSGAYEADLFIPQQYPFTVGTITAQASASGTAVVEIEPSGPTGSYNFLFGLPAGPQGPQGNFTSGPSGPTGASGATGATGPAPNWSASGANSAYSDVLGGNYAVNKINYIQFGNVLIQWGTSAIGSTTVTLPMSYATKSGVSPTPANIGEFSVSFGGFYSSALEYPGITSTTANSFTAVFNAVIPIVFTWTTIGIAAS